MKKTKNNNGSDGVVFFVFFKTDDLNIFLI